MKILFLCYHGLSPDSGVSKKMLAQVDAMRQLGHTVHVCTYDATPDGRWARCIDGQVLQDFGCGRLTGVRQRCCYGAVARFAREQGIEMAYIRSFHNANPFTIGLCRSLRRAGAKVVVEIPTWPYDHEYAGLPLKYRFELLIDKTFRRALARAIDAFVTFADVPAILGQRAICISNGFALTPSLSLKGEGDLSSELASVAWAGKTDETAPSPFRERAGVRVLHLLAVAEVHYWHGLDRLVEGLGLYHGTTPVELHIVGYIGPAEMHGSKQAPGIGTIIGKYHLEAQGDAVPRHDAGSKDSGTDGMTKQNAAAARVVLHGALHGEALEEQFRQADFAIGSLGRHRSGITSIKTLKNREYAARGLAFCYSEQDSDFDHQPYVLHIPADESPVDVQGIVDFTQSLTMTRQEIAATVQHLSWKAQMKRVIDSL